MTARILPAALVVVVANLGMLASVRANRSGDVEATVQLTERELRIVESSERDSSQRLTLEVWALGYWMARDTDLARWLTEEKLTALGFHCAAPREAGTKPSWGSCGLDRRVFVVFEFDGPAWAARVERLRREASSLANTTRETSEAGSRARDIEQEIAWGSRLVAVDASSDAAALRLAHPDRSRKIILLATINAFTSSNTVPGSTGERVLNTSVRPVTQTMLAPVRFRAMLSRLGPSPYYGQRAAPRFTVRLAVGRRYEPWIVAIDPIDTPEPRR